MGRYCRVERLFLSLLLCFFFPSLFIWGNETDQVLQPECVNCFSSEIIDVQLVDNCVNVALRINAEEGCVYALSHLMVSIPCGTVSDATNSGNWPMELMVTDATTGITGLKVDSIENFGEDGKPGSFTLTFSVCSIDVSCIDSIGEGTVKLAYKAANCVFYEDIQLKDEIPPLTAEIEASPASCFNSADGSVTTTVSGGVGPYSYLWNNGAATSQINNVTVGTYSVLISDAAGSEIELFAEVDGSSPIIISGQISPALCAQSNGAIDITVVGGAGGYSYLWSNGAQTEDVSDLVTGVYQVKVTDSLGCYLEMPYYVFSKSPIQANAVASTLECYERRVGTITLEVWGGTEPYSFVWSNGATTQNLDGLNAGTYRVTITDAESCKLEKTVTVSQKIFFVSAEVTPADCSNQGGEVVLKPQNGTQPYVAEWSNGETGMQLDSLISGSYMVMVTDSNGCRINQQINVGISGSILLNTNVKSTTCNSPIEVITVDLSASGGTEPYTYYVNGQLSESTFETNQEGDYVIDVIDFYGCSDSKTISLSFKSLALSVKPKVTGPDCENPYNAYANIEISNGTAPYTIMWNGVEGGISKDSISPGSYVVNVVDANGCEASASFEVTGVLVPTVDIIAPEIMPECNSITNRVEAQVINGESYYWTLSSSAENWIIISDTINHVIYNSGTGNSTLVLVAKSADGCEVLDYIELSCTASDDDDDIPLESCTIDCITLEKSSVTNLGNGCIRYGLTFVTDGSCLHDLSHLVIDMGGAYAMNVSNNQSWDMEVNITDPKSGLTGIKVDNITDFGKHSGDKFTVTFDLCNATGFDPSNVLVSYKAWECIDIRHIVPDKILKDNPIELEVYPNPSESDTYFEFTSSSDTHADLTLYDQTGVAVTTLFSGNIINGVTYKVVYSGGRGEASIMFYRLESGEKVLSGKILRLR